MSENLENASSSVKTSRLNPLLMESIVEHIFRYLPDRDVKSSRLVCRLWLEEARRTEDKRHGVTIDSIEAIKDVLLLLDKLPDHQISSLHLDELNLDHPLLHELIRRLSQTLSKFRVDDCKVAEVETLHAMICGFPNLVKLTLGTVKPHHNRSYYRLFPIRGPDGTNMVFPHIHYLDYISYNEFGPPTYFSETIKAFPNLITLTSKNMPLESPSRLENLRLPNLRKLFIQMVPRHGLENLHLEMLMKLNLKLRELILEVVSYDLDPSLLKTFIESQSETLEDLSMEQLDDVFKPEVTDVTVCPFPLSSGATNVKLAKIGKLFIRNLVHVLNSFPSLHDVVFSFPDGEDWERFLPKKLPIYEKIESAVITWIGPKSLVKISNSFTGLLSLKIHECDDKLLEVIFRELRTLKSLICYDGDTTNSTMTDLGFTGMSPENPPRSITNGNGGPPLPPLLSKPNDIQIQKRLAEQRKNSYVGNLKDLEYLYLHFRTATTTEHIIWHGVLHLEKLRSFLIYGIPLSKNAVDALEQHNNMNNIAISPEAVQRLVASGFLKEDEKEFPMYHFKNMDYVDFTSQRVPRR